MDEEQRGVWRSAYRSRLVRAKKKKPHAKTQRFREGIDKDRGDNSQHPFHANFAASRKLLISGLNFASLRLGVSF